MNGEILVERQMNKEDIEMMKFMQDHKEDFFADIQEIIRKHDKDDLGGLFG